MKKVSYCWVKQFILCEFLGKDGTRRKSRDDTSGAASTSSHLAQRRKSNVVGTKTGVAAALSAVPSAVAPSGSLIGKISFDPKQQPVQRPASSSIATAMYPPIRNIKLVTTTSPIISKVIPTNCRCHGTISVVWFKSGPLDLWTIDWDRRLLLGGEQLFVFGRECAQFRVCNRSLSRRKDQVA